MKKAARRPDHRGVSLVEVVIAITIFAAVFAVTSQVVTQGSRLTVKGMNVSIATQLVNGMLEECRLVAPVRFASGTAAPWVEVAAEDFRWYFPKTLQELEGLARAVAVTPRLRYSVVRNALGQVREVWLEAQIDWLDAGSGEPAVQTARSGLVICNPEAR